jgi:hypothetical protein
MLSEVRLFSLGVFSKGPCTSITVQICGPPEIDNPSMYVEMLTELISWRDNWLDQNGLKGTVNTTIAE